MNTFEITIQRKAGQYWPLVIRHNPGGGALAVWSQGSMELDLQKLEPLPPTSVEFGQFLGKALFRDDIRDAFVRALSGAQRSGEILRVLLFIEAEDLRGLHWEQLHAPLDRGWDYLQLNQSTPFSIYLPSQIERRFPPIGRRDLRALIFIAGADELSGDYGLADFDIQATCESVGTSLGEIPYDILASVEGASGKPTLDSLSEHLNSGQYTLLHIVCHGAYQKKTGETVLYFPKDERRGPTTASDLIRRLERMERLPQFTFLSTCESADPEAETGLGGLAQRLIRDLGVPAVLAMTDKVSISTAQALSTAFYTHLREHGEVDRALGEAMGGLQGHYDVTVPALFSRLGGRPLFSDTLDRPLTDAEVRFGLEQLRAFVQMRAPVLAYEFESHAARIQSMLGASIQELSAEAQQEYQSHMNVVNQLCGEVLDISFNALALGQTPPDYDARCPFRGLMSFGPEDREFFFGREATVARLADRLKEHNFLAVLGPSGSGKSSLVLAGLVPALEVPWGRLTPGADPLSSLEVAETDEQQLIVIDQFEELFTLVRAEEVRQAFISKLLKLSESKRVVITMRADFWGEVAPYAALRDEMQAHQELVAPMNADELRRAMELQADRVGLRFEGDLGQDILDQIEDEPGAMPLLQHALLLLWQRRHGRWLRLDEYRAIGGVQKAIASTADALYENLSSAEQERVRDIFMRLTRLGEQPSHEEIRDTRRRVAIQELVPAGDNPNDIVALISKLADARLVVTSEAPGTKIQVVEVAHEALIRHWPRLRAWLDEDRASLRLREGVRQAAYEWEQSKRDVSLLVHRGGRLEDAQQLSQQARFAFNELEKTYLDACLDFVEKERRIKEQRRRIVLAASLVVAVVTTALAIFGLTQSRIATERAILARSGQLAAQSQALVEDAPPRSLLLAIEAINTTSQAGKPLLGAAQEALRAGLADPHGIPLAGHEGGVETLAVAPDSRWLATGGDDGSIKLWDLQADTPSPRTIQGDLGEIKKLAFSPDNHWLAAAGTENFVALWDTDNLDVSPALLEGHDGMVTALAFSADGQWLAAGSVDQTLLLWDLETAPAISTAAKLTGATGEVTSLSISPNNQWLAAGSIDQNTYLWDLGDLQAEPVVLAGHAMMVTTLAFSSDGKWLAIGSKDKTTLLWDLSALDTAPRTLSGHTDWVNSLAFSPDGKWLASGSGDSTARLWDLRAENPESNPVILRGHLSIINILAFSADSRWLATGSADNTVRLWDMESSDTSANSSVLRGHEDQVRTLAFSPNGAWLVTGSLDGIARLWDMRSGGNPAESVDLLHGHTDEVNSLAVSPDGKWLASGGGDPFQDSQDNNVRLWELNAPDPSAGALSLGGHEDSILVTAFDPSGKWLATASTDRSIRLWEVSAFDSGGRPIVLEGSEKSVTHLAFDPGGKWLASGSLDGTVRLWDFNAANPSANAVILDTNPEKIGALAFDPGGAWLAAASGNTVKLWKVNNLNAPPVLLNGHEDVVAALAFSPDGAWLASAGRDASVRLWNTEKLGEPAIVLSGHTDWVTVLAFSPNTKWLASAGRDASVLLWNVDKPNAPPLPLLGHADTVNALAFNPDSKWLASGSDDNTARLWNLTSPNPASQSVALRGHRGPVTALAFSPDSRWLVTGSTDQTLRRWLLPLDEMIQQACFGAGRNLTPEEWMQYFPDTDFRSTCQ